MNTIKLNSLKLLLCNVICISGIFYSAFCYSLNSNVSNDAPVSSQQTVHFNVFYKSRIEPLPLNKIHSWILHVNTLDEKPVEKAKISVYGGMPAHKHGLPTQPAVRELGGGDYLVEGLKFNMNGGWEIWFNIRAEGIVDKVKFEINF